MAFIFKMIWGSKLIMNSIIAIILFYLIDCYYASKQKKDDNIDSTNNTASTDSTGSTDSTNKYKTFKFYLRMFISVFLSTAITNLFWR